MNGIYLVEEVPVVKKILSAWKPIEVRTVPLFCSLTMDKPEKTPLLSIPITYLPFTPSIKSACDLSLIAFWP